MKTTYQLLCFSTLMLLAACSKDAAIIPALPAGNVTIQQLVTKDTLERPISVLVDSVITIELNAMLKEGTSTAAHNITFSVDTSKIADYESKYGSGTLLPKDSYFFYRPICRIPAGATVSDAAQLNITNETLLEGYTTYVLPVTISSVDNGDVDAVVPNQVLYLVIKTGKPAFVSKTTWTIVSVSSETTSATDLLDKDNSTYWFSSFSQNLPQNVVIDFGKTQPFSAISYYFPLSFLPNGYPTQIKIELSTDGTTWTNEGTFDKVAPTVPTQLIPVSSITARYMRFTILAGQPYFGFNVAILADISLVP